MRSIDDTPPPQKRLPITPALRKKLRKYLLFAEKHALAVGKCSQNVSHWVRAIQRDAQQNVAGTDNVLRACHDIDATWEWLMAELRRIEEVTR